MIDPVLLKYGSVAIILASIYGLVLMGKLDADRYLFFAAGTLSALGVTVATS
jgi:hypothetical protein